MFLLFLLAMIPILWLVIALSVLKMPGHKACFLAWILTAFLSVVCWKFPAGNMATATLEGVLNALWPICLVIIAALFTYNLILKTGAMEEIKKMLAGVSKDKRVLLLLIGWGFGNFMEGMAGFGTAVAIPASMLAGIGVDPIGAVVGCLVVNSTPTAFGSVGVPTVTLVSVAGVETMALSAHPFPLPSGGDRLQKRKGAKGHGSHDTDRGTVLPDPLVCSCLLHRTGASGYHRFHLLHGLHCAGIESAEPGTGSGVFH